MKKSSTEYAESLIEKYREEFIYNWDLDLSAYEEKSFLTTCAIKDVESTIEALDKCEIVSRRYYRNGAGFGDDKLGKEISDNHINNDGRDYFAIHTDIDYYTEALNHLKSKG